MSNTKKKMYYPILKTNGEVDVFHASYEQVKAAMPDMLSALSAAMTAPQCQTDKVHTACVVLEEKLNKFSGTAKSSITFHNNHCKDEVGSKLNDDSVKKLKDVEASAKAELRSLSTIIDSQQDVQDCLSALQDILSAVSDPPSEPIPEQTAGPRQEPEEEKDGEPHQEQTEDSSHVNG